MLDETTKERLLDEMYTAFCDLVGNIKEHEKSCEIINKCLDDLCKVNNY